MQVLLRSISLQYALNTFTRNSISFPHGRSTAAHKSNQLCNVISPMNNIGYMCAMNTSKDCRLRDCTRYFIRSLVVILLVDALYIHLLATDKCEIIVKPYCTIVKPYRSALVFIFLTLVDHYLILFHFQVPPASS